MTPKKKALKLLFRLHCVFAVPSPDLMSNGHKDRGAFIKARHRLTSLLKDLMMAECSIFLAIIGLTAHFAQSAPIELVNITIVAPAGSTNHSDPHRLGILTKTIDVVLFFLQNYLAHAATVRTLLDESSLPSFLAVVLALLFPVSGISRGLTALLQYSIWYRDDPHKAALRAGAVCEVIRTRFCRPRKGDVVRNVKHTPEHDLPVEYVLPEVSIEIRDHMRPRGPEWPNFIPTTNWTSTVGRYIHGRCDVPNSYRMRLL